MSKQGSWTRAAALVLFAALGLASRTDAGTFTQTINFWDNSSNVHSSPRTVDSATVEFRLTIPHSASEYFAQQASKRSSVNQPPYNVLVGYVVMGIDSVAANTTIPNVVNHRRPASTGDTLGTKVSGDSVLVVSTSTTSLRIAIFSGAGMASGSEAHANNTMAPGHTIRFQLKGGSSPIRARFKQPSVIWFTP